MPAQKCFEKKKPIFYFGRLFLNERGDFWRATISPKESPLLSAGPKTLISSPRRRKWRVLGYAIFCPIDVLSKQVAVTLYEQNPSQVCDKCVRACNILFARAL